MYTDFARNRDFRFFKKINSEFFSSNGHKFLAIRNKKILYAANTISELLNNMKKTPYSIGEYIVQECTGNPSAYTVTISTVFTKY